MSDNSFTITVSVSDDLLKKVGIASTATITKPNGYPCCATPCTYGWSVDREG